MRIKLTPLSPQRDPSLSDEERFDNTIEERRAEADEFYGGLLPSALSDDLKQIARQALAGMLWSKQFYRCDVASFGPTADAVIIRFIQTQWLNGDPAQPPPPPERKWMRNRDWKHLHIEDVLSMP